MVGACVPGCRLSGETRALEKNLLFPIDWKFSEVLNFIFASLKLCNSLLCACQHLISALAPCCCVILKLSVQNSTEDLTKPESAIQGGGRGVGGGVCGAGQTWHSREKKLCLKMDIYYLRQLSDKYTCADISPVSYCVNYATFIYTWSESSSLHVKAFQRGLHSSLPWWSWEGVDTKAIISFESLMWASFSGVQHMFFKKEIKLASPAFQLVLKSRGF